VLAILGAVITHPLGNHVLKLAVPWQDDYDLPRSGDSSTQQSLADRLMYLDNASLLLGE